MNSTGRMTSCLLLCLQVCKAPVAALGLLQRSQQLLSDENAYADEKINVVLPNHLSLLHRVACEQHSLIPQVRSVSPFLILMTCCISSNWQILAMAFGVDDILYDRVQKQ